MHIVNGDAAAGSFREAFGRDDDVLVCRDVLSCGPIEAFEDIGTWKARRERYWAGILAAAGLEPKSFDGQWRDLYAQHGELAKADTVRVWIGCSLSDQLVLAFVATRAGGAAIELVQYRQHKSKQRVVRGLGELRPEEARAHPEPRLLDEHEIRYCQSVWQAFTAPDPVALIELQADDGSPLAETAAALATVALRFPDSQNGLSLWDERLLTSVRDHGPRAARVIGHTLSADDTRDHPLHRDCVGDLYLFARLKAMGSESLEFPLVRLSDQSVPLQQLEVESTDAGHEVLAGEANAVDLNGIDDWVGGVHLDSASGQCWFRHDGKLALRRLD